MCVCVCVCVDTPIMASMCMSACIMTTTIAPTTRVRGTTIQVRVSTLRVRGSIDTPIIASVSACIIASMRVCIVCSMSACITTTISAPTIRVRASKRERSQYSTHQHSQQLLSSTPSPPSRASHPHPRTPWPHTLHRHHQLQLVGAPRRHSTNDKDRFGRGTFVDTQ